MSSGIDFGETGDSEALESQLKEGMRLNAIVCRVAGMSFHQAQDAEGNHLTLIELENASDERAQKAFTRVVRFGPFGGLEIAKSSDDTILSPTGLTGTLAHISSLNWRLPRRVKALVNIAERVSALHSKNAGVGPLNPESILLDDRLHPILIGPMVAMDEGAYRAPELGAGAKINVASDVYSLGQLLRFVLAQQPPPFEDSELPRLDDLMTYPAGLSRIVRKATLANPEDRYASVAEMINDLQMYGRYQDVGIAHPDVKEENVGGMSLRPMINKAAKRVKANLDTKNRNSLAARAVKASEVFCLESRVRWMLLIGGIVAFLAVFGLIWVLGDAIWTRLLLSVAAGVIGFAAFRAGMEEEVKLRLIFATFAALFIFIFDPGPMIGEYKERAGLLSSDAETRLKSFRALKARGFASYSDLDLSDVDLSQEKFTFSRLTNVSFENANLEYARFESVGLINVNFKGANLAGAFMSALSLDSVELEGALCNEFTQLFKGWHCEDGLVAKGDPPDAENSLEAAAQGEQ